MADLLRFRKGTIEQINSATKVAGTIYIAKDEKAMYVDVDASTRIRIGDFVRVATVNDIPVPYSETAIYYVEADNALLDYKKDAEGNGKWSQINGTEELEAKIIAAEQKISALEGTVGSATSGLVKDVADLKTLTGTQGTAIQTNADDITALKAAIGMNEDGDVEGLAGDVAKLRTDLTTAEGEIDALQELTQSHTGKISALETASAKHAEKTYVDDTFVTKAFADPILAKVDTTNGVTAAIEAAVNVEKDRAEGAELALTNAVNAANGEIEKRVTNTAFDQFKAENTTAIGAAKTEAIEAAEDYADGLMSDEVTRADNKYATKLALEATDGVVSGHTSSISTINETLATKADKSYVDSTFVTKAVADAKLEKIDTTKKISEAIADAVAAEAAIARAAEEAAQNAANAAHGAANAAQTDATAALEAIGDASNPAEGTLRKAVADNKAAAAKAQKTADDYATAHAGDYTNAQIDEKVKAVSDVVAGHTGTLTTLTGEATVAGSVAEAKKAGTDAQAAIDEWKTAHAGDYTNTQIDNAVADAKKAGTDAAATAKANGEAIQTLQGAVNTLNGEGEGSVKKAVADAEGRLNTEIANKINAANAMDYKGGVGAESDLLAKTDVKVGDTYVATQKFTLDDVTVYPGDLVIAQGAETNGVVANPTWDVVHTGYDASLEQTITTADGKIQLTSATGNNNGQVAFESKKENGNTSAVVVEVANNVVSIGMVWEDFE